jgi:hypothetical protein
MCMYHHFDNGERERERCKKIERSTWWQTERREHLHHQREEHPRDTNMSKSHH